MGVWRSRAGRGTAMALPLWLGAEQGEHAAVGVGDVRHDHAVLRLHRRDYYLAAEFLSLCGGRGDVRDLDDENGVRRDVAAGVEDPPRRTCGACGGGERRRPPRGQATTRQRGQGNPWRTHDAAGAATT